MKIAVIGSGISGLMTAYLLGRDHHVVLFEAAGRIGGHAHTIEVPDGSKSQAVDTGFVVFNEINYPNFSKLLRLLGVESQPTAMSFSVRNDETGVEYNGSSLNQLFSDRRNLLRPSFHRMLGDILRFHREARRMNGNHANATVGDFVAANSYSSEFANDYLLPLGSSLWSCPRQTFQGFPIRFLVDFMTNHRMLQVWNRPTWRVVKGGSRRYVDALLGRLRADVRLHCPVQSVRRFGDHVTLSHPHDTSEKFDHAVLACHSDQALSMLADASSVERRVLEALPYQKNDVVLHTDTSVLPRRRRAWASWNYHVPHETKSHATVTYNMNMLQGLRSRKTFCVTLNETEQIDHARSIRQLTYEHPVFTSPKTAAQGQHRDLVNNNRTSFCGAYWGYGFHEDGVNSALRVCESLGQGF